MPGTSAAETTAASTRPRAPSPAPAQPRVSTSSNASGTASRAGWTAPVEPTGASAQSAQPSAAAPCVYYARGHCHFGASCRFRHDEASVDDAAAALAALSLPDAIGAPTSTSDADARLQPGLDRRQVGNLVPIRGAWDQPERPRQRTGIEIFDENVDLQDPWEMSGPPAPPKATADEVPVLEDSRQVCTELDLSSFWSVAIRTLQT